MKLLTHSMHETISRVVVIPIYLIIPLKSLFLLWLSYEVLAKHGFDITPYVALQSLACFAIGLWLLPLVMYSIKPLVDGIAALIELLLIPVKFVDQGFNLIVGIVAAFFKGEL